MAQKEIEYGAVQQCIELVYEDARDLRIKDDVIMARVAREQLARLVKEIKRLRKQRPRIYNESEVEEVAVGEYRLKSPKRKKGEYGTKRA